MSVGVKLYQSYPKCPEAAARDVPSSREAASLTMCKFYKTDPLDRFLFYVSNNLRTPSLKNTSNWRFRMSQCTSFMFNHKFAAGLKTGTTVSVD